MLVQAHRGASAYAPENTLPAFERAAQLDADGIECDVHCTADGFFLVCHDPMIDRTSSGSGLIGQMTLAEIRKYDFGSWFSKEFENTPAPVLEELLETVRGFNPINVEIKKLGSSENFKRFYKVFERAGVVERALISSFDLDALNTIKELGIPLKTAYLCSGAGVRDSIDNAYNAGCAAIHPCFADIDGEYVALAHEKGIEVNVWTLDDPAEALKMREIGCDGIITNRPDVIKKVVGRQS